MKIVKIKAEHKDGAVVFFNSVKEAALFAQVTSSTMSVRIKSCLPDSKGWMYTYADGIKLPEPRRKRTMPKRAEYKGDDVELDREKYNIIPYHVIHKRICVTPCPFMREPKNLVGSGQCIKCSSFRGRNKKSHEVACRKIIGK